MPPPPPSFWISPSNYSSSPLCPRNFTGPFFFSQIHLFPSIFVCVHLPPHHLCESIIWLLHHFPPFSVFSFVTPDRLSSVSTSLSPPVSLLYPSLHSEFLLANCSGVEAHRSSPLMLTLLHDSCWRNPTGTRRTGGARGGERLRQRDGMRGQGKTKEGRREREMATEPFHTIKVSGGALELLENEWLVKQLCELLI